MTDYLTKIEGTPQRAADRGADQLGFEGLPEEGYLGDPTQVDALLRQFFSDLADLRKSYLKAPEGFDLATRLKPIVDRYVAIFHGQSKDYTGDPVWNAPDGVGGYLLVVENMEGEPEDATGAYFTAMASRVLALMIAFEEGDISEGDVRFRLDVEAEEGGAKLLGVPMRDEG